MTKFNFGPEAKFSKLDQIQVQYYVQNIHTEQTDSTDNVEALQETHQNQQSIKPVEKIQSKQEIQKEQYTQEAQELLKLIKSQIESKEWKQTVNKNGIIGYKMENCKDNQVQNKSEGIIDAPIEEVKDILFNLDQPEHGKVLNKYLKIVLKLKEFSEEVRILQNNSNPPIVSDLYSVLLEGRIQENGMYYQYGKTIDLPEGLELYNVGKAKQSICPFQGWSMKKCENDPQKTQIHFVSCFEVDGMPGFIKNSIRNNRGYEMIQNLSDYIKKRQKNQIK